MLYLLFVSYCYNILSRYIWICYIRSLLYPVDYYFTYWDEFMLFPFKVPLSWIKLIFYYNNLHYIFICWFFFISYSIWASFRFYVYALYSYSFSTFCFNLLYLTIFSWHLFSVETLCSLILIIFYSKIFCFSSYWFFIAYFYFIDFYLYFVYDSLVD